jgi:hypothetical protein
MRFRYSFFLLAVVLFVGCKKETEEFKTEALSTYLLTQPGKYITYRTDSTATAPFGTRLVTRSYQEKHLVDALMTDNLGRPAYRIFRYIRDTSGTGPWQPTGSYFITPLTNSVEVVDNNLRFIKLVSPIKEGNSWQGHRYLPSDPFVSRYDIQTGDALADPDWDYTYESVGGSESINGKTYGNTVTVDIINDRRNAPVTDPAAYGNLSFAMDKYAKGIGLIYQEFILWEYQPNTGQRTGYSGFGVRRSIIDHN